MVYTYLFSTMLLIHKKNEDYFERLIVGLNVHRASQYTDCSINGFFISIFTNEVEPMALGGILLEYPHSISSRLFPLSVSQCLLFFPIKGRPSGQTYLFGKMSLIHRKNEEYFKRLMVGLNDGLWGTLSTALTDFWMDLGGQS